LPRRPCFREMASYPTLMENAMAASETIPAQPHHRFPVKQVLIGTVGTTLEWYDFGVYGFFAAIIGKQFFPAEDEISSVIAAFGAFAAGFLARPFGALVFGQLADRKGRSFALTASVLLMAVPTFLISILPTHAMIGAGAGVMLVLCRVLQGLSVGGEHTCSIVYLVEHASKRHKGLAGSFAPFGASGGILLGSAVGALLTNLLSEEQLESWGWRVPQAVGLLLAMVGLWIRRHNPEADHPSGAQVAESPMKKALRNHKLDLARVVLMNVMPAIGFYTVFVYLTTWLQEVDHLRANRALEINTVSMVVLLAMIPVFGWLADLVGPIRLLWASALGMLAGTYPLFHLMHQQSARVDLMAELGFAVLLVPFMAASPAALCALLPKDVRCTVLSLGFNLTMGLLGGTTPLVVEYLRKTTHMDMTPAYYLMAGAVVTVMGLLMYRAVPEVTNGHSE
jgi:MHS family proline/betaine transporter-like MFS transporter